MKYAECVVRSVLDAFKRTNIVLVVWPRETSELFPPRRAHLLCVWPTVTYAKYLRKRSFRRALNIERYVSQDNQSLLIASDLARSHEIQVN